MGIGLQPAHLRRRPRDPVHRTGRRLRAPARRRLGARHARQLLRLPHALGHDPDLRGEPAQSFGLKRGVPLVFSTGWIRDDQSEEGINYYVGEPGTNALGTGPAIEKPYYSYVTEIDPFTGEAVKHTSLGRIHHENVAIADGPSGHMTASTGDDAPAADGMFFKYVSNKAVPPGCRGRRR